MEINTIAQKIEERINLLSEGRKKLVELGENKAKASAHYEMTIAKTLMQLKNGVELKVGEETIKNPPASIMDKLARGICFQERMDADMAENAYKSAIVIMKTIESETNAYQSINKFIKEL